MKPIGHWYVRKERRGLVCLVIDNRHAVEKLKHLEDQTSHTDLDKIEDELPLAFADIFPLSTSNHKRGESPERKFVVAFGKRRNDDSRRSEEPDIHKTQTGPSTPNGHRLLVPYSPREDRSHQDVSMDSDAESIGQSTLFQSNRKSRARTRPIKEQAISRLILDIIPHEEAEKLFQSAQNMSRSNLLEVRAEETIDMLMRKWTYVDPKYFSEDDRSSIASTEPSLPIRLDKTPQSTHGKKSLEPAERIDSQDDVSRRRTSDVMYNIGLRKERDGSQSVSPEVASSSSPALRNRSEKKRPSPPIPTFKNLENGRGAKAKRSPSNRSDQELQSTTEPSTPAPPYPSGPPGQCPSCHAESPSAPTSHAGTRTDLPIDAGARDTKETNSSIDSALRLFENKSLEILEQLHSQQLHQATEQQERYHQALIIEQEADPVILKDCLGRKFLFPIEKCRSWQVSSPRVEQ